MNLSPKQNEVRQVISDNHLSICAILESYVSSSRLDKVCSNVFRTWYWFSNGALCEKGSRIILGWNPDDVDVTILSQSSQVMHTHIMFKADNKYMFCSFVYAHNRFVQRRDLWHNLEMHKVFVRDKPWCLMGDFNSALNLEDKSVGSFIIDISMREFKDCVENIEVSDVNKSVIANEWDVQAEGNLHDRVKKLRHELDEVQIALDRDPSNMLLREEEAAYLSSFNEAILNEEMFLKQKSKVEWLQAVPPVFVSHYIWFLGKAGTTSPFDISNLFINTLLSDQAMNMVREITSEEVKGVIFSMGNEKSPGPDGFIAVFFKEAWDIVGLDVINAVKEFFISGKLLKEINHTIIALIPKVPSPTRINDYRPISCCNVLLKCITKIISNRLKDCLKHLVSINQSAFVPGREISDNILLTQEIMHNYHLDRGPARCAFKVDIQKAYDMVDWGFLKKVLIGFGFHSTMVGWIMECVTSISFSLCINGVLHSFFKGKCGLRQVIMDFLEEFKSISGLVPSIPKSMTYFYNVLNHTKLDILHVLPFEEGTLLVKYLGVPLVTIRLVYRDCKELVEKVQSQIADWKNKFLSFAGRLQLAQSVISSMHIY
ncbi:reverse transcriptase domain-containing protein [Tanacetum coccineum]